MTNRISSGNKDLDLILGGGIPSQSITLIGGGTGTGKTTLMHQILYANLKKDAKAVYVTALGKPVHKIIRNMQSYDFFNADILIPSIYYEDLGEMLEREGLRKILDFVFYSLKQSSPDFFCIDGIHRIRSISPTEAEYFSFIYELTGLLSASRCTALWIGMYTDTNLLIAPEASVSDHVLYLSSASDGDRRLKVMKLSQSSCPPVEHRYAISSRGLRIESAEAMKKAAPQPAIGS